MNLEIEHLTKEYHHQIIFQNKSFVLLPGKIYFLTNENGTGKTTFFKCLLDETKYVGKIKLNQLSYSYLPDKVTIPKYLTVEAFIHLFIENLSEDKYKSLLKIFMIEKYQKTILKNLSKGTLQKVLIIKTLLEDVDLYLFDEPLSGLDRKSRLSFIKELSSLQNKIIVVASHYFDEYNLENKQIIDLT